MKTIKHNRNALTLKISFIIILMADMKTKVTTNNKYGLNIGD